MKTGKTAHLTELSFFSLITDDSVRRATAGLKCTVLLDRRLLPENGLCGRTQRALTSDAKSRPVKRVLVGCYSHSGLDCGCGMPIIDR